MSKRMFESMVKKPKSTYKWLFFPISLLFHGLVIAAVIVMPLLNADAMDLEVKVYDVFLQAPAPPQTPAPPKGKRAGKSGDGGRPRPERPVRTTSSRTIAPVVIPEEIPEESFDDIVGAMNLGDDGEVVGGVIGIDTGVAPSILGTDNADGTLPETFQLTHVQPPRLIRRVAPQYPSVARKAAIQGVVLIEAVTDIYGKVVKVKVTSGHPLLRNAAIQAVEQWIYEPYILNGIPKPVLFTVNVNFKLNR